jgi:hypothetical protein
VRHDDAAGWIVSARGAWEVAGNFGDTATEVPVRGGELVLATDEAVQAGGGLLRLPARAGAVVR